MISPLSSAADVACSWQAIEQLTHGCLSIHKLGYANRDLCSYCGLILDASCPRGESEQSVLSHLKFGYWSKLEYQWIHKSGHVEYKAIQSMGIYNFGIF